MSRKILDRARRSDAEQLSERLNTVCARLAWCGEDLARLKREELQEERERLERVLGIR